MARGQRCDESGYVPVAGDYSPSKLRSCGPLSPRSVRTLYRLGESGYFEVNTAARRDARDWE